jgi:hypothetical protein
MIGVRTGAGRDRCASASRPAAAPEIDSGSAIAGVALALGGLVVLRSRRLKIQKN